jgi:signal transduction histidine kinase
MRPLAALLSDHRAEIVQRWKARVLGDPQVPEASHLAVPALEDHIPSLLDELIEALGPERTREALASGTLRFGALVLSQMHGRDRQSCGYTLESAIRELSLLRGVLLELVLNEADRERPENAITAATIAGVLLMHRAIDECMAVSAAEIQRQSQAALEDEREVRERFIAVLAHDLRSPLANVVSSTELLLRQAPLESQVRTLERIVQGARRIGRMVDDLLEFAEVRMGQIPIRRKAGEIAPIIRELVESFGSTHPRRAMIVTAETPGEGEWDADRVAQILNNLLLNANAYSPAGSPLSVTVRDDGDFVILEVHNQGHPIPPEDLPRIFEPFHRGTRATPATRGLGLGLYIVREIVRACRGTIEVLSGEGTGTRFIVRLARRA